MSGGKQQQTGRTNRAGFVHATGTTVFVNGTDNLYMRKDAQTVRYF